MRSTGSRVSSKQCTRLSGISPLPNRRSRATAGAFDGGRVPRANLLPTPARAFFLPPKAAPAPFISSSTNCHDVALLNYLAEGYVAHPWVAEASALDGA